MSNNIIPSIETLPVEILHRIFDNLDAETILFTIRPVCRLFRAVVNIYDRYVFDLKSISKRNFHLLCRLINPQNIVSLTLCDNEHTPGQIALFISLVRLRQLTRLHSINFIGIEEFQLNMILKRINLSLLTSFSLNIRKYDERRKKTTLSFLSSIMGQSSLRKVELNIKSDRISNISWPLNCTIKYLIIYEDLLFDDLCRILSCSPQLHTLILRQNLPIKTNDMILPSSFSQLTSLAIEELYVTIDKLESFLLLTPSLTYLKFIGGGSVFDGKRWEQFIQINLPHLNTFEFFIYPSISVLPYTREELEVLIDSFRSPFWIEYKKWFVACEFNFNPLWTLCLYSIPICKSVLEYNSDPETIFLSTYSMSLYHDPTIRNNIKEVSRSLKVSISDALIIEALKQINPFFTNVTKLHVDACSYVNRKPLILTEFLTSIIDVSQLVEVKLESFGFDTNNKDILFDVMTIIEQSYNLSSLIIHSRFRKYQLHPFLNNLCSVLPRPIKHLQIPISQLDQIKIILERCQSLSVVQFEIACSKFSQEVVQWFTRNTIDSTFRRRHGYDIIWIGKKTNEISINHKRIKLTDDNQFNSEYILL